jgi:anti-sigma factor RsiW
MNCPLKAEDTFDVLLDYSAGKLDRNASARFERHIAACAECTAFVAGQSEVWKTLDVWEPQPVGMDFNRQLSRRIDAAAAAPWYTKLADSLRMGAWKQAVPLAAAVVLVTTAFMMDHQTVVKVTPNTVGGSYGASLTNVSATEAEQLEQTLDDIQLMRQLDAAVGGESTGSRTM